MTFNNSTSLPLPLVTLLAATGSINRVKSYFLVNSMMGGGDRVPSRWKYPGEADEETSLLLRPIFNTKKTVKGKFEPALHSRVQGFFLSPCIRVHPASPGLFFGPVLKLHRAFFADMQDGGWLHAWLTSSMKNIGELFTALQMFVVWSELYKSMDGREKMERIPKM
ncbi:hypothetical protein Q9L58_000998 [Maublancomyces gigas]|uniref:Uncharacterized protein n=1 Tax=Discina gigas TaxID=1032678 RepID=A0ABR3GVI0_9PEZI